MPSRTISRDLKDRIPVLFFDKNFSMQKICDVLGIKKTLVYKTLDYHTVHGTSYNPAAYRSGRPRILDATDIKFILALIEQCHTIYIDEIQEKLLTQRNVSVSVTTLLRTMRRLELTRKCVSIHALERNDLQRSAYMNRMADLVPDANMLMFIDEAAKDDRTLGRSKGWSLRGQRCIQRRAFIRGKRYSILPVITLDGTVAHDIVEGAINSTRFIQFLEEHVIPLTNPYPGPRSVLVLDNCSIHHAEEVRVLVEDQALCKLVFLPPYSPDLNPIEQAFASIKAFLRRHWKDSCLSLIDRACHNITPDKAWGYFRASGYVV
ncbi:Tc1-mariner class transposase [Mycena venus]|uniref:Tc1-mariner class transposase n=1 Tax=Mycena venus TaxID=2733690 RepID=A0A8H6XT90_9AGAR|nr:Tc1-mariner class transposase [Mycena venus]